MKEIIVRSLSGIFYVLLLVISINHPYAVQVLFFVFGLISLSEFKKMIQLKSTIPYFIFIALFFVFAFWQTVAINNVGLDNATQVLMVITIFVQLFLIKGLFSKKTISMFMQNWFLLTTFYISSAFVFLVLIANYHEIYNPNILLGTFILVWVNDSFAYLVGKNFGKQKLFEKISPKKTVEGFLGGLFFSCIASFFIANFTHSLSFTSWLILGMVVSVFGTLGDLIESKFKRQAAIKDSGNIMPGHGGLLDRLDSIIFAAPFIYLFLRIIQYVS